MNFQDDHHFFSSFIAKYKNISLNKQSSH